MVVRGMNGSHRTLAVLFLLAIGFLRAPGVCSAIEPVVVDVGVDPVTVNLNGHHAYYTLLVHGKTQEGRLVDLTHSARFISSDPQIASVSEVGIVRARSDGANDITVEVGGRTLKVPVKVAGTTIPRRFNFETDIVPILSRFGCNSSGCHGKAEGQNGFKLSVFGFDPPADFNALAKEGRGRRVFPGAPEHSLLLTKASGVVAHGGGLRIQRGSADYETLRGWIAAGLPFGASTDPRVESIRVEPRERLLDMHGQQQLRVIGRYSDGRELDVTGHAKFQSNNDSLAVVSAGGLIQAGDVPGDVAVMAAFMGAVDVFRAIVPRADRLDKFPDFPANNFIDPLVVRKLQKLHIAPSELATDAEYMRRVYLDVIGTLPTADEARRFLSDTRPERRAKLVDELLQRPEFADYWALKWADLLRVDRQALGHKRAYSYYKWIRESLASNKPLDQFARELVTAEGPLAEVGPANFYKVVPQPGEAASTLSQILLGVRITCAQCHHHPYDRWSQTDYYGMQAFFAPISVKASSAGEMLMSAGDPPTKHPRTGETIIAHALGTTMPEVKTQGAVPTADAPRSGALAPSDRRLALADWLTASGNPWFARNLANRAWAHFLGRGLVEPVDDVRETNPPSNPELLDALSKHLVDSKYDFKQLVRAITGSRVYQLSSRPNATNERDEQNYSRAVFKRVDAEVLLDMVCQTTGVPERFEGVPPGARAIQLWDSKVKHYFLKIFGRPQRVSACECERVTEPGVAQILHILNSPEMHAKLGHDLGSVERLSRLKTDDAQLAEELYLTFFSRMPNEKEKATAVAYLRKDPTQRRQAAEDLAWSMLNSLEFVFNH